MSDGNEERPETTDCQNCGVTFFDSFSACPRCDRPHELLAELEELAEDWDSVESSYGDYKQSYECARELREVLDSYE